MSSGDFMNLTFRNTTTYRPDGSFIPEGYIFTVSSYGKQNWTNNLRLNSLVVSTFTLNSTFIVASTNTNNMVIFSSLTVSSTDSRNLTYSTLIGDTILTNNLTLNSNLNVGSTFASLHQASTFAGSSIGVYGVTASTTNVLLANLSTLSTGTHTAQTLTVTSTLTGSTMVMGGASVSTIGVSSLVGGAVQVTGLLTTSSLAVPGQTVFSTMLGSTVAAHALTLQSTLLGSSIQCVNLLSERATVNALTVPSTAVVSTAILNLATVSSFAASTLTTGLTLFSTLIGAAITASTLTLNTIVVNSTLITSTFATGSLNFSTLVGSSIVNNILAVTSTATISTTTTSTLVVNRVPTTEVDPPYKMVVEQGSGQNENAFYIGNSNGGSAQGLSIGMVNEGFSFFGSYAKIQGKRSGSAGTTNLILQPDTGKVGIGTTNPDAVLDVYAPTGTPATLFVYNGASGINSTGADMTVASFNIGSSGSGLYYDSIRIRVPNGAATSAARMDFCTPATVSDNAQITRLSIAPYTGYIGIGTTGPTNLLHIHSGNTNLAGLRLTSGSVGWGSGMLFENTTAMTGRTYGIYTDSLVGSFHFTDVSASLDRMVIDSTGQVGIGTATPSQKLHVYGNALIQGANSNIFNDVSQTGTTTTFNGSYGSLIQYATVGAGDINPVVRLSINSYFPTRDSTHWNNGASIQFFDVNTNSSYPTSIRGGALAFFTSEITAQTTGVAPLERMRIAPTGNVGIGTNNPIYNLHVHGDAGYIVHQIKNVSATGYSAIYLGTDDVNVGVIFKNGTSRTADGGVNTMTIRNDSGDLQLQGGGGAGMIVKVTSGYVGIGTASPSTILHVAKSVTTNADYSLMTFYQNTASGYYDWAIGPQVINSNALFSIRGGDDAAISSMSNFFNVHGNGNVGIGTTNPLYRLHALNGNASKALFGPNTTWGGFLLVGAGDNELTTTTRGQIIVTDGNLHLDAGRSKVLYLGYYANEAGFPNSINSTGTWTHNSALTVGGTIRGNSHWYWAPDTNWYCTATGNNQNFTFDMLNQGTYSGCTWGCWSDKNSRYILMVTGDTERVAVGMGNGTPAYTLDVGGDIHCSGSLYVGNNSNGTTSMYFGGVAGDHAYDHTVIEQRLYSGGENSELLLFKGNDPSGGSGPDRIRLRAGAIVFDTYSTYTTDRTAENIRMTISDSGAVSIVGALSAGSITTGGSLTGHEVYANSWFRVNGNGGLWFESYGRGLRSPDAEGNSYGNVCTHGTGRNGWSGYGMTTRHTIMSDGTNVGIHDNNNSWCIYFDGSRNCTIYGSLTVNGGISGAIPYGVIVMWSGSIDTIPSGWALCNGGKGTPDLRDRFIVGAGSSYGVGATGGADTVTLSTSQIPSHTHNYWIRYPVDCRDGSFSGKSGCWMSGPYTDTTLTTSATGDGGSHENRPPYYALCYIMKV